MDTSSSAKDAKIPFEAKDLIPLESRLQIYSQEMPQQANINNSEVRMIIKDGVNKWASNIFRSLEENSILVGGDEIGGGVKLHVFDPADEEMMEQVKAKEAIFTSNLMKTVNYRTQVPAILANLSHEICEIESQAAERLEVKLPAIGTNDEDLDQRMESAKKDYLDAVHLLSQLNKTVPEEINRIHRVQELTALMMKQN